MNLTQSICGEFFLLILQFSSLRVKRKAPSQVQLMEVVGSLELLNVSEHFAAQASTFLSSVSRLVKAIDKRQEISLSVKS
jgi:hypothetical protein